MIRRDEFLSYMINSYENGEPDNSREIQEIDGVIKSQEQLIKEEKMIAEKERQRKLNLKFKKIRDKYREQRIKAYEIEDEEERNKVLEEIQENLDRELYKEKYEKSMTKIQLERRKSLREYRQTLIGDTYY